MHLQVLIVMLLSVWMDLLNNRLESMCPVDLRI